MALLNAGNTMARCTLIRQYPYELEWMPESNYVAGTIIQLRSKCLRTFYTWKYNRMEMEKADIIYRWRVNSSVSEKRVNPKFILFRARLNYGLKKGEKVKIWLVMTPFVYASSSEALSIWIEQPNDPRLPADTPPPEPLKEEGSDCPIPLKAGPVDGLAIYSKPMPDEKGKVKTLLVPEDRFGNPSEMVKPVRLALEWEDKKWNIELKAPVKLDLEQPVKTARLKATVETAELGDSDNIMNGVHFDDKIIIYGNSVWPQPVDGLKAGFGEFHWHTDISGDGDGSIEDALRIARDSLNFDYAAPGDHNTRGNDWDRTVKALNDFNDNGNFATFFGWENGSRQGHENYYFTDPEHPLVCEGSAGIKRGKPHELVETLKKYSSFIAIPHHTNAVAESRRLEDDAPFWHPYPWTEPVEYIRLVEIFQVRGNQERDVYDDAWRGWHQNNGSSVQEALELGYRIGFTGGTDNHWGWPGRAYGDCCAGETNQGYAPYSFIMTGVWTKRIERQSIFDALWSRHTWAVWNTRALVLFNVNGMLMGGELKVKRGEELKAYIRISAEDSFQSVEIISEKQAVWRSSIADRDFELTVPLQYTGKSTHFYLRALLRNGGIIYASPVFVALYQDDICLP